MLTTGSIREARLTEAARRRGIILDSATAIATNGGYDANTIRTVADNAGTRRSHTR